MVGFALAVPAFALIGAFASMPMFGALFRVHAYLRDVEAGTETEPLTLRDGDPLQEMAAMVSRVTENQRGANREAGEMPWRSKWSRPKRPSAKAQYTKRRGSVISSMA